VQGCTYTSEDSSEARFLQTAIFNPTASVGFRIGREFLASVVLTASITLQASAERVALRSTGCVGNFWILSYLFIMFSLLAARSWRGVVSFWYGVASAVMGVSTAALSVRCDLFFLSYVYVPCLLSTSRI
jgi:hypothetical protein